MRHVVFVLFILTMSFCSVANAATDQTSVKQPVFTNNGWGAGYSYPYSAITYYDGMPGHIVLKGESLSRIAMRYYGADWRYGMQAMLDENPWLYGRNKLVIYAGEHIRIPIAYPIPTQTAEVHEAQQYAQVAPAPPFIVQLMEEPWFWIGLALAFAAFVIGLIALVRGSRTNVVYAPVPGGHQVQTAQNHRYTHKHKHNHTHIHIHEGGVYETHEDRGQYREPASKANGQPVSHGGGH